MAEPPLLSACGIRVEYQVKKRLFDRGKRRVVQALSGVDLDILAGETIALVGESGSGKSTLGRALIGGMTLTEGSVHYRGREVSSLSRRSARPLKRHLQIIFQDPYGSLNPRLSIGRAIAEPILVHGLATRAQLPEKVAEYLTLVGLDPDVAKRKPHEFSGGQRQRIAIARAIALQPDFIVADEPLSALDMSLQGQMVDLFQDLKRRLHLTYLFISHDLNLVRQIADRVAVMYLGQIVELATTAELFGNPRHPYTQALLAAVPVADPLIERHRIYEGLKGEPPSPANPPPACRFHTRCAHTFALCRMVAPPFIEIGDADEGRHIAACHLADQPGLTRSKSSDASDRKD